MIVSFCVPAAKGQAVSGIKRVRVVEDVPVGGVSTASAERDEVILFGNDGATMAKVAWGPNPDANATGMPVGANLVGIAAFPEYGDKVSVE